VRLCLAQSSIEDSPGLMAAVDCKGLVVHSDHQLRERKNLLLFRHWWATDFLALRGNQLQSVMVVFV
jgi:hypothetical protein